eukprot:5875547-Heterocapsa_arctica.AAC.1
MRKRKDEKSQPDNLQPGKKDDNPVDFIPNPIPTLGIAIPGVEPIPTHHSGDKSGKFIPPATITYPASGSADRPRYSEHPA